METTNRPIRVRIVISYVLDYVILAALVAGFFILDKVEPFHQKFSLRNYTLQYPYAEHEIIPIPLALALSGGIPLAVIGIYTVIIDGIFSHHKPQSSSGRKNIKTIFGPYKLKDRLWELNCGILGLFLAQAAAFVITAALKNACGKPRPDLISRCLPPRDAEDAFMFGLSDHSICTQKDNDLLKDGFRSFPSASFAGLFYLSLYLAGKLHLMDNRGEVWKTWIVMIPTLGAALIATTRIMDARHHPFDVISGSMLGILCAYISYRQYFPPISESWRKGRAYPIRTWGQGANPPPPAHPVRTNTDQSQLSEYADGVAQPLDPEYQGMTSARMQAHRPKHAGSSSPTSPPHNPFESTQYSRRRPDVEGSSSSGESGSAFEMQSSRGRSESRTHLDPRYHGDMGYRPALPQQARPPSGSPPLGDRPVSVADPLRR
ncbi:hypothetical protein AJ80_00267 [Polytolypa hystricis UAMH7299]|uniref:Phosphatidic acid phosphatase type 2/haloperoxidase domain-containing protein n=1 Tax=Polytolypa hystricis (strain UAMH7299) TaxID=1447883 RepID=A0A2B7Z4P1_POLH7|nr:hypothetical protein AJ80_00267 [Polytolypa hystricis UAMH7299]